MSHAVSALHVVRGEPLASSNARDIKAGRGKPGDVDRLVDVAKLKLKGKLFAHSVPLHGLFKVLWNTFVMNSNIIAKMVTQK